MQVCVLFDEKMIRIEAYSLKESFNMSVNLRRLESMPKQNIKMKT